MHGPQIILTLAAAQVVLAMIPGPNTILILQSALHGRKYGLAAAAGVWPVTFLWAAVGLAGLGALMRTAPGVGDALSLLCGSYLTWLGIRVIARSLRGHDSTASGLPSADERSSFEAFRAGAASNLTNPKTIAYFTSVFTATGASVLSPADRIIVMIMMPTISFCWYGSLAMLASHPAVHSALGRARNWLDRVAGLAMIGFAARLFSALWRRWSVST